MRVGLFFYRIELTERTIVDVGMYGQFSSLSYAPSVWNALRIAEPI